MTILAAILSAFSFLMALLFLIRIKIPLAFFLLFAKLFASALSPLWAVMGVAGAVLGWLSEAYWAVAMGVVGAGMMIWYIRQVSRGHRGFEQAFGPDWSNQIPPEQISCMVRRRWPVYQNTKLSPESSWERDLPFWTIPGTDRELLCDLWQPADGNSSGLAFIYYHGSSWTILDKDFMTRPFFRHLLAQGHTIMDVSYRLCPETDIYGMIGDIKRAIAWMKNNASRYGVDPEKVVLGGGSAGAHLALLAAYAPDHPELTPKDLKGIDLEVAGVVSYYGNSDLFETDHWMRVEKLTSEPAVPIGTVLDPSERMRFTGRLDMLLGGYSEDVPDVYRLASPVSHVHPDCPPTLLLQGQQDLLVPVDTAYVLHDKLVEASVPAINIVFPWTEHAFDLAVPQVNPVAQSAMYDVDRFLAVLLNGG